MLTVHIRAASRTNIPQGILVTKNALKSNIKLSLWLLETFTNQEIIREFLVDCPVHDMGRFVSAILKTAMETIYKYEEAALAQYIKQMDSGSLMSYIERASGDKLVGMQTRTTVVGQNGTPGIEESAGLYSAAAQVNVLSYNEQLPSKIPTLVAFINSFLHFQSSPLILERFLLTAQFQALIGHFATIGPMTRLYLLKTGTLSRMLRLLFVNPTTRVGLTPSQAVALAGEFDHDSILSKKVPLFQLNHHNLFICPSQPFT